MRWSLATATASADERSAATLDDHDTDDPYARTGRMARRVVVVLWVAILVVLLRQREIISSDTLSNYVHVWFVAEQVWHGHGLPFHMPVLAHGTALAFPYSFIPWMVAVLLWPVMGEWSVGAVLGIGFLGLLAGTFWAFPEVRRGWWAVAVLLNPGLIEGLLFGQLPFLWAAAMFVFAIGAWRRDRRITAVVLAALAQLTHAAVLVPLVGATVVVRYRYEPNRRALVTGWIVSLVASLPAIVLVFASPVTAQNSIIYSSWIELETVALRALVVAVPVGLVLLQRHGHRDKVAAMVAGILVIGQLVTIPISGMTAGFSALNRKPDPVVASFPESPHFVTGATYRVLTYGDGRYGQYAVVRAGGRLDSEFFPESLHRRSFPNLARYTAFLHSRQVDYVIVDDRYRHFRTNEQSLLDDLAATGSCVDGIAVHHVEHTPTYDFYAVSRTCQPA